MSTEAFALLTNRNAGSVALVLLVSLRLRCCWEFIWRTKVVKIVENRIVVSKEINF